MGLALKKPKDVPGKSWPAIAIGLFVAFGGVLYGYDTGTIAGIIAMSYWQNEFSTGFRDSKDHLNITASQQSEIVSILSAGTFFGALLAAPIADRLGRRLALIVSSFVFIFGVILQTASTEIPMFVAGRFFAGLGVGLISALIPLYQSETAPKWIRGVIVGSYQLAITIGLLLAAIVNNSTHDRNDTGSYRIPIAVQFAWAIVLITGMLILPETPRYLIRSDKPEKAARSLSRLRRLPADHPAIQEELDEIQANHEHELSLGKSTYLDCFRGGILKRQLTGCGLQALQQLTGINFIFYYGTQYFKNSGITNAFIISMITSSVNTLSTLPGLYAIDKWGRRPLLFWGAIGMTVSQLLVAVLGTTSTGQNADGSVFSKNLSAQKASIAFVCIYIFFFASTWGPIAWVVTGEIFPLKVRAKALSMTTATNWLLNWAIAYSTPYLVNFGPGNANLQSKIFFIWFACCFLCIAFVYFMIYETKGLTLEQIDELYDEVKVARKSVGWKPTTTWREIRASTAQQGGLGPKIPAGNETETTHEEKLSSGPEYSADHES
jgi:sugar porter (SP) family MFS transporter